jgi:DNA-binding response OmpR family regulator
VNTLPLRGRSILVVEDDPLIALDLETLLRAAGAQVHSACSLERALQLTGRPGLSAAVLDYGLSANDCSAVCERLRQRRIPFVLYRGYLDLRQKFPDAVIIPKPAALDDIVDALNALLRIPFARSPFGREAEHARR